MMPNVVRVECSRALSCGLASSRERPSGAALHLRPLECQPQVIIERLGGREAVGVGHEAAESPLLSLASKLRDEKVRSRQLSR